MRDAIPTPTRWLDEAAIVAGLVFCQLLLDQFRILTTFHFAAPWDYLVQLFDVLARYLIALPVLVVALHAALRVVGDRWRAKQLTLLLAGAALSAWVLVFGLPYEPLFVAVGASASTTVALWYEVWNRTLASVLALIIVERLNARRAAAQRLLERQERARVVREQLAWTRLQAIQARVDPQLLFDMLTAVKRFYERDVDRAEGLLDELTAFLRAALPRLHSVRSSLEVEFALVGCYVRMLRAADAAAIELKATLPDRLANAVFPAGVLLPLIARTLPAMPDRSVALDARSGEPGPLQVRVTDAARPDAETIDRLRTSLGNLYGERACLRCKPLGASGAEIELELPYERA